MSLSLNQCEKDQSIHHSLQCLRSEKPWPGKNAMAFLISSWQVYNLGWEGSQRGKPEGNHAWVIEHTHTDNCFRSRIPGQLFYELYDKNKTSKDKSEDNIN